MDPVAALDVLAGGADGVGVLNDRRVLLDVADGDLVPLLDKLVGNDFRAVLGGSDFSFFNVLKGNEHIVVRGDVQRQFLYAHGISSFFLYPLAVREGPRIPGQEPGRRHPRVGYRAYFPFYYRRWRTDCPLFFQKAAGGIVFSHCFG